MSERDPDDNCLGQDLSNKENYEKSGKMQKKQWNVSSFSYPSFSKFRRSGTQFTSTLNPLKKKEFGKKGIEIGVRVTKISFSLMSFIKDTCRYTPWGVVINEAFLANLFDDKKKKKTQSGISFIISYGTFIKKKTHYSSAEQRACGRNKFIKSIQTLAS